jgi:hypothetical protein
MGKAAAERLVRICLTTSSLLRPGIMTSSNKMSIGEMLRISSASVASLASKTVA